MADLQRNICFTGLDEIVSHWAMVMEKALKISQEDKQFLNAGQRQRRIWDLVLHCHLSFYRGKFVLGEIAYMRGPETVEPRPASRLRLGYWRRWFGENVTILICLYSTLPTQIKNLKTIAKNSHVIPALSLHKKKPIHNQAWIEEGLQREPTLHCWAVC